MSGGRTFWQRLMARRVKVQGDLFHGRLPLQADGRPAVYVGRGAPGLPASIYANPFKAGETVERDSELWPFVADLLPPGALDQGFGGALQSVKLAGAEQATACYSRWFFEIPALLLHAEEQLGGRDIACWCPVPRLGDPDHCHGAWLLGMVEELVRSG